MAKRKRVKVELVQLKKMRPPVHDTGKRTLRKSGVKK
jgi:hypothetical protein